MADSPKIFHGLAGDFDKQSYVLLDDYRQLERDLAAEKLGHEDAHRQLDALHRACEHYENQWTAALDRIAALERSSRG